VLAIAHVAVAVVVNSLTLTHCQGLGLRSTSVADFCYQLIRGSLMFARFLTIGMGSAYTRDGLYASIYSTVNNSLNTRSHSSIIITSMSQK